MNGRFLAAALVLLATQAPAAAQEVRWRHDYQAARAEAQQTGLPLMIDISAEWCGPCKRLDATTFRDPRVVKLLNERFIPVKLDGDKHEQLVQSMGVDAFPTMILAGPDGVIRKALTGFQDANTFLGHLKQVAPAAAANAPVPDALAQRRTQAASLLAQAKLDYQARLDVCCLDRCAVLASHFRDLPESAEATRLADQIRGDAERMQVVVARLRNQLGEGCLTQADHHLRRAEVNLAVDLLQCVVTLLPNSPQAAVAAKQLTVLRGPVPAQATSNRNE
jgi:thioredoxin-like negative regulator of GroEL